MGLEAFKRQDSQREQDEQSASVPSNTVQTDLQGRILANSQRESNPQVSLKEYER